jgi:anti-sigma regulatory factor (Ser/Thr protein kinase)
VIASDDTKFRHEALLYAGIDGFMAATVPFLRDGAAAGEPALVAVDVEKTQLLKDALGADSDGVEFVEMREVGRNPARIIPVWRDFVAANAHGGRPLRGIGEPVWAARTRAEMTECECHEALLNVAFDDGPAWQLLCPYDTETLDAAAIAVAGRTHPWIVDGGARVRSDTYVDPGVGSDALLAELPPPPADAGGMPFGLDDLSALRSLVARRAGRAGIAASRAAELALAVHELATNSVMHGGGRGDLLIWLDDGTVVCEVRDMGSIDEPLAGRALPKLEQRGGHGLWLVNQMCDLVQLRSGRWGSVVRVHMYAAQL